MLIDGKKWACEACIRGHRVTSCKHHGASAFPTQHTKLQASSFKPRHIPTASNKNRPTVDPHKTQRPTLRNMHNVQCNPVHSTRRACARKTRRREMSKSNANTQHSQQIATSEKKGEKIINCKRPGADCFSLLFSRNPQDSTRDIIARPVSFLLRLVLGRGLVRVRLRRRFRDLVLCMRRLGLGW